mmetsp:Transcript_28053/g.97047  ORF Transcript_28053/g.97047 Transcript_28053/m.97047 type:complete len:358 (-) Transcript_28053:140-1213(-)
MAAEFIHLWRARHEVVDAVIAARAKAAEENAHLNTCAALLQRLYRGAMARRAIRLKSRAARTIQRVIRGARGRAESARTMREREEQQQASVFHYYASIAQRIFRGYYSRRYIHNYHSRKLYIQTIQEQSEVLRKQLEEAREEQIEGEMARAEEKARDEFRRVTQNLHHLVSTASTPGVYNPPYAGPEEVPTAFNVPIEEHLRTGVRDFLRTNGLRRTRRPPSYAGADSRVSLQASSKYHVEEEVRREEARYNKLRQLDDRAFKAGGKPDRDAYRPGIAATSRFQEGWLAARSERELEHTEEAKAKRVSAEPFHVSVTRNRAFGEYERARSVKGRRRRDGTGKPIGETAKLASEHAPY